MKHTQYNKTKTDDFSDVLSEWITLLYNSQIRRISFVRFKPKNQHVIYGGFLSLYSGAVLTGAGHTGRDIAELQRHFGIALDMRLWLSQILFWHHVLDAQCESLSFDIHRSDLVSNLLYSNKQKTRVHAEPISAYEGAEWFIQTL